MRPLRPEGERVDAAVLEKVFSMYSTFFRIL